VDELHDGGEEDAALALVAAEPRPQQEQRGPDPLSSTLLDVASDLRHQLHIGEHLRAEDLLDLRELVLDEGQDLLEAGDAARFHGIRGGHWAYR
jgi:hypothetical protein